MFQSGQTCIFGTNDKNSVVRLQSFVTTFLVSPYCVMSFDSTMFPLFHVFVVVDLFWSHRLFSKCTSQNILNGLRRNDLVVVLFCFRPQNAGQLFLFLVYGFCNYCLLCCGHGIPSGLIFGKGTHQQGVELFFQLFLVVEKDLVVDASRVDSSVGHLLDAVWIRVPVIGIRIGRSNQVTEKKIDGIVFPLCHLGSIFHQGAVN